MSLNDLYAAQIESHFFFYLALGAATTCVCLTLYACTNILAAAISKQKVVIQVPVHSPMATMYEYAPGLWTAIGRTRLGAT